MTRTIVIVDAFSTGRFLPPEMARYGVRCVHVRSSDRVPEFFLSGFRPEDFVMRHVFSNLETTAAALRVHAPFCVIAGSEAGVGIADQLAQALGLPANEPVLSAARRQKSAMADALHAAGVRAIRGVTVRETAEAFDWMRREGLQELVAKPIDSAGTEDVFFCRTPAEIERAATTILGKTNLMGSYNSAFLVQERIRGKQYTVNAVAVDGRLYVGEIWTYETREVPGAGSICSHEWLQDGESQVSRELVSYLNDVASALGVLHGPVHAEIIIDDAGPAAVDVAARLQGLMSPVARRKALGHTHVTLTAQAICDPMGFAAYTCGNEPYQRRMHALCVSLISETCGTVRGIPGLDAIRALPSFADAIGFLTPGKQLLPTRDLVSTPGIVYLVSAEFEQIRADFAQLRAMPMDGIFALA